MKKIILYRLVRCFATYHFFSYFVVFLVLEMNGVSAKPPTKTKLLLQNIRTQLTQQADELVKEKECGMGLVLCKNHRTKKEEGEGERSEEIDLPPNFLKAPLKPLRKIKTKSTTKTSLPKANTDLYGKSQKAGKRESYRKFIRSPDKVKVSRADDNREEDISGKGSAPVQELKWQWNFRKKPLKNKQKLPLIADAKFPKVRIRNFTYAPSLQSIKKTPQRKIKLDEEDTNTKIHKTRTKEGKKSGREGKGKRRVEAKEDNREPAEFFVFPNEPFPFAPLLQNAQRNACEKQTQLYLKHLQRYELWALMMYDASAKLAPGILRGNANQFGDFDECLSVNVAFKKSKNKSETSWALRGKYCLANIDVKIKSGSSALRKIQDRIESFQFIKSTIHDPVHFIPRFSTINWGLCVPSACLAEDVEKFLKSRFDLLNNASGLALDVRVDKDNCVVKSDLKFKFDTETTVTALLYAALLTLTLYATYFNAEAKKRNISKAEHLERELEEAARDIPPGDTCQTQKVLKKNDAEAPFKGKLQGIVAAFSLKKNVKQLFTDKNRGGIECINGIKSIFTVLLYFAHKTIPLAMTPFNNRVALTKVSNQPITVLLRASIVYTDSFLLMSGMLMAYGLAKEISEKKQISWIKKSVGRFIRLTPPLLAVVLFYAYIWDQMGNGPLWNLIVRRNSLLCRQYLWRNLLYIQNLFDFENMCAPQTHQLALDMQLSLLAPLFVHLMHSHDKVGFGTLQALFIFSSIMRYITTFNNNLSVVIYHGMPVAQLYKTANLLYAQALHRASPYILGIVVGFYLRKLENQPDIPKSFAALGWVTAFCFGYYSLASPTRLAFRTYQYNAQEAAQYAALSPVAWSLALSWVIAACHLGFGGKLNEFLCHKIFLVFSRISYSVYLTQFLVFFYKVGVKKNPEVFTFASSFCVTEFVIVIVVSVIITLLLDIPTVQIKKIILDEKKTKTLFEESNRETFWQENERESEMILDEDLHERTEEVSEDNEENSGGEDDMEEDDIPEGSEGADEEGSDDDEEMIEAVFEIRPLRRTSRIRYSDESEDKEHERNVANK